MVLATHSGGSSRRKCGRCPGWPPRLRFDFCFCTGAAAPGGSSDTGSVVVPFDKRTVKRSPRANRDHLLTPEVEAELIQHYELSA